MHAGRTGAVGDDRRGGSDRRRRGGAIAALVALALGVGTAVSAAPPASAATKGAGFGTWSAVSAYGWHGSMLVDGVWTFCISPGLPAPVGASQDAGVTAAIAGLSPAQLTGINLLVSKYGQTSDPVTAASVAWAVKAIADPARTLHEYGYRGSDLAGAINWTFSRLAPAHNAEIQRRATAYYAEARSTPVGSVRGSGALVFTRDAADPSVGTVRADAPAGTTGTLTLTNGRFADGGSRTLAGAAAGRTYRIAGVPPRGDGMPYRISGSGRFGGGWAAAVHLFRTPGQQSTAGPGGKAETVVSGADTADRTVPMRVRVSSRIGADTIALSGPADDTVTVRHDGTWPRDEHGDPIPVVLRGQFVHYPTAAAHTPSAALPADARVLGETALTVTSDGDYRASTGGALPRSPAAPADPRRTDAGQVGWRWSVVAADQAPQHRGRVIESAEQYAIDEQTSPLAVPEVTTRAQAGFSAGATAHDVALVRGTLPVEGADLTFAAYAVPQRRAASGGWEAAAPAGTAPGDLSWVCTDAHRVFTDAGHGRRITAAGDYSSPAAAVPEHAKILWVETLSTVPAPGRSVQPIRTGACGDVTETGFGVDITTRAQTAGGGTTATPGAAVHDVAELVGHIPEGGSIAFEVYAWPTGRGPVCDRSSLATTLHAASANPLAGGLHRADEKLVVDSEEWSVPAALRGSNVGFVEVLRDAAGREVHRGACGAPGEVITVAGPHIATGGTAVTPGWDVERTITLALVVLAGLAAVGAVSAAIRVRRGRRR